MKTCAMCKWWKWRELPKRCERYNRIQDDIIECEGFTSIWEEVHGKSN